MKDSTKEGVTKISVSEAMNQAQRIHQEGHLDEARSIYQQILLALPDYPDALHYLGLACYQSGESQEALTHIRAALEMAPEYYEACNNLGIITQGLGQFAEAEACYRKVIKMQPGHANSHNNLGVVLKSQGRMQEAVEAYQEALNLDNSHSQAHHNLGNLYRRVGQTAEAVMHFRAAIDCGLDTSEARHALVNALYMNGEHEDARRILDEWQVHEPDSPIVQHLLAALHDAPTPSRASDDYVRIVFDGMAPNFDEHLGGLEYRAHKLVVQALVDAVGPESKGLSVLDAGCGTGLCGPLVRPLATTLIGIDLSPKMLHRARVTQAYDDLIEVELTGYIQKANDAFDAIICADTLCYFGDLEEVTQAVGQALRPGGRFVFTVEDWVDEKSPGYQISFNGRYNHGRAYVQQALTQAGLQVEALVLKALRQEIGEDVNGLVITALRP